MGKVPFVKWQLLAIFLWLYHKCSHRECSEMWFLGCFYWQVNIGSGKRHQTITSTNVDADPYWTSISLEDNELKSYSWRTYCIQCSVVIAKSVFCKILAKDPHSLPVRARYGVSFVDSNSHWYSTSVNAVLYAISYYIGLHFTGTQLYCVCHKD